MSTALYACCAPLHAVIHVLCICLDIAAQIQIMDARGLKRIVTALEKKYRENLELRLKYPDAPAKFLESEVDLDEQVKSLMQVRSSCHL